MLSPGCFGSTSAFLRSRLIDRRLVLKNRVPRSTDRSWREVVPRNRTVV